MGDRGGRTARPIAEIARPYGFSSVEGWRWIKQGESPAVAEIESGGRRYVARLFAESDAHRAAYIAGLLLHLARHGVDAEEVVSNASGEPVHRLMSDESVILSPFYPEPPVPVPFDGDHARAWGRYVARMHAACRDWRPTGGLLGPGVRQDPSTVLERALSITASFPMARDILEDASEQIMRCREGAPATHAVHGDSWPGNLLKGPDGLRAIDFAEAGEGPRTIDLATAFRWMPWRDDRQGASRLWGAWLAGYSGGGEIIEDELDAVQAAACLQHLTWMVREAESSRDPATISWYVRDHCSAIRALLAADVI